jgi:CheY-like chemotaxis protein
MLAERVVLRAELFHDSRLIVGHTTQMSATSVFVCTDEKLDVGDTVQVRLSFPRLLAPLDLVARVVSRDAGSGHGYQPGFTLDFDSNARLERLLGVQEAKAGADEAAFRVLVVEDSAVMRDTVQHTAERFFPAFHVETDSTEDAEGALARIDAQPYDLALVDLFLPGTMNGADLVRAMRQRGLDTPVIGFSIGGTKARTAFLEAGADMYLDKPVMLRDIFGTLKRLVYAARSEG